MNGKMIVIEPDGTMTVTEWSKVPSLKEVQKAVGGYVECLSLAARWEGEAAQIYINEDGKNQGLQANTCGTLYASEQVPGLMDVLVGNVVVLVGKARWS